MKIEELTTEQIEFLVAQNVPISRTFNAKGLTKKDYSLIMAEEDLLIAFNVTPCKAMQHTLRTRHGHCAQCNTQALAFIARYTNDGQVYLLHSKTKNLSKIGTCKDVVERLRTLNSHGYGNTKDWELVKLISVDNAARVELNIGDRLHQYRNEITYQRTGKLIKCQEIYNCDLDVAIKAFHT